MKKERQEGPTATYQQQFFSSVWIVGLEVIFYFLSFVDLCFLIFFHNNQVLIVYKILDNSLQVLRVYLQKWTKLDIPFSTINILT